MNKTAQQQNREDALKWWRSLNEAQQIEMWQDWKLSLESNNTKGVWSFLMIKTSDNIINEIYNHVSSQF